MIAVHNARVSQFVAVAVTLMLELFFSFLGGWTLYDTFLPWGFIPAIIIGVMAGITLFLLYLYTFIFREYAVDAVYVFSAKRRQNPGNRLVWAAFLCLVCVLMDSFFNADRMIQLPTVNPWAKFCIWVGLELLVLVPFALGKLVHAHVNVEERQQGRAAAFSDSLNSRLYSSIQEILPNLTPYEILQLHQGNPEPLQRHFQAAQTQKEVKQPDPLAALLTGVGEMFNGNQETPQPQKKQSTQNTDPLTPVGNGNGKLPPLKHLGEQ